MARNFIQKFHILKEDPQSESVKLILKCLVILRSYKAHPFQEYFNRTRYIFIGTLFFLSAVLCFALFGRLLLAIIFGSLTLVGSFYICRAIKIQFTSFESITLFNIENIIQNEENCLSLLKNEPAMTIEEVKITVDKAILNLTDNTKFIYCASLKLGFIPLFLTGVLTAINLSSMRTLNSGSEDTLISLFSVVGLVVFAYLIGLIIESRTISGLKQLQPLINQVAKQQNS